ncbi:Cytochrome P450 monooxygenase [Lachnellula hyalina]|uniref:Cytochrome P450 monooxygenase n=1 Tax=Lachnellula hyalina TaxID=1316788 RepID=A0A8H8QW48_9HELO|nr:Cytochrome P450 monooxygenase [Lachnellula hyalina]TVY23255.1 Cytochrome P450 monooxygenase [Lachnellula hyalina]
MATVIQLIISTLAAIGFLKTFLGLTVTTFLATAVYRVTLHPLANIPGPRLWAITRLPYFYNLAIGRLHFRIHELHEQYGLVVRVAPGEITLITESSWSDIYLKPPGKPEFRKELAQHSLAIPGLVLEGDDLHHSRKRKNFGSGFTEPAMRQQEPTVIKYIDQFIFCLRERSSKAIELNEWYSFLVFDIMGDIIFGESFDSLETGQTSEWAKSTFSYAANLIIGGVVQKLWPFHKILGYMVPPSVRRGADAHEECTKVKLDRRLAKSNPKPDMITPLLETLNTPSGVTYTELRKAIIDIIIGATDTITLALGAMVYFLSHNQDVFTRLTYEIRMTFSTSADITNDHVKQLPYLNAAITEMLRLSPPIPGFLRRIVPPAGCFIGGSYVPRNTIVSYDLWAGGHSAENFFRPNEFLPERYLANPPDEFKNDKRKGYQPFSFGPRNCIGKNLALLEVRLIISKLLWEFNLELQEESRDWIQHGAFDRPPLMVKLTSVRK